MIRPFSILCSVVFTVLISSVSNNSLRAQDPLPAFDFTQIDTVSEWVQPHDCVLEPTPGIGLTIRITGSDPYFHGPPRNYPPGNLWLHLRIRSEVGGMGQVFYFQDTGATEENSVRFHVPRGDWTDVRIALPSLAQRTRLRIDPPGGRGICEVSSLTFSPRPSLAQPEWPAPALPTPSGQRLVLKSGSLSIEQDEEVWDAFRVLVDGQLMAIGHPSAIAGYMRSGKPQWFPLESRVSAKLSNSLGQSRIEIATTFTDPDGGRWSFQRTWEASNRPGGIECVTRISVDQDRDILFLPAFLLFPGVEGFGTNKVQGLFAGLEYLANEPSSSELDLIGAQARRQVTDHMKITFPLMALVENHRYLAWTWENQSELAALHDSPDRIFNSGGHVWGMVFPGSDPDRREVGSVLPYDGWKLSAGHILEIRGTLMGGHGQSIVPAVQEMVARRGLPPLPASPYSDNAFLQLTAHGWLDTDIRNDNQYRHAVGPTFPPQQAADAAVHQQWLSQRMGDDNLESAQLSARLRKSARAAIQGIPVGQLNYRQIGHIRHPLPALVLNGAAAIPAASSARGHALLKRFRPDGTIGYQATDGRPDFARTHWEDHANGLTAQIVCQALIEGLSSGDRSVIDAALDRLRQLHRYDNDVPRGAQTWEIALHTPDILASAHLVRAFVIGYELTGELEFLDAARYWAWTGVPFIYLDFSGPGSVGNYSTIAVLGATHWVAPNWMGLPVQWCGLVYADALLWLARHDPDGPWLTLVKGITIAGIQHVHPMDDEEGPGLLPDSFDLRVQSRNPVPINPGTLQALAQWMIDGKAGYDVRVFRNVGMICHAPGPIEVLGETARSLDLSIDGWPQGTYEVLLVGVPPNTQAHANGLTFFAKESRLVLSLDGKKPNHVRLDW